MDTKHLKYMSMAHHQALVSKALNHKVGAILVRNDTVISQGFNGPPRGIPEKDNWDRFPNSVRIQLIDGANDRHQFWHITKPATAHPDVNYDPRYLLGYKPGYGIKWQLDSHAERNAIFNAARIGVSTFGASMYCWCGIPCKECTIAIIQAGITEVFCLDWNKESLVDQTEEEVSDYNFYLSDYLLREAQIPVNIILREVVEEYEKNLEKGPPTLIDSQGVNNDR